MSGDNDKAPSDRNNHRETFHHNIRMSEEAYQYVKKLSQKPEFHGRGFVGVLDKIILGRFTTIGSGRVGAQRRHEREMRHKKPE